MKRAAGGAFGCLGDLVAEAAGALLVCGIVGGIGLAFIHAPVLTGAIVGAVILFAGYGGWLLVRARRGQPIRGRLALAAVAAAVAVGVVIMYALSYCPCVPIR